MKVAHELELAAKNKDLEICKIKMGKIGTATVIFLSFGVCPGQEGASAS